MKSDLDLGPDDYRIQDPKTGRWHMPDDPKMARNLLVLAVAALCLIFAWRNEVSSGLLFAVTAMFSFFAGGLFALWQKNRYF